jgi:hypothetical protein
MQSFEGHWRKFYPNAQGPTGWMMRRSGAVHWLRFHSLPQSKRYAETEAERRVLLARQNALAYAVLGHSDCWLVQTCWVAASQEQKPSPNYPFEFSFEFLADEGDDDDHPWKVYASAQTWGRGTFDNLLLAIANDDIRDTIWLSCETGAVFAPYDGGVDLFLPTQSQIETLKAEHRDWLSPHPDGL